MERVERARSTHGAAQTPGRPRSASNGPGAGLQPAKGADTQAAAVLRLFAIGQCRFGLSDTAACLGLPKGTVHGILHTLRQGGLVEQDPASGKYQLGAELARLGGSYLQRHELRARALPWADDLARTTGEAVHVGVLHGSCVLIIHHVFRPDETKQVLETGTMVSFENTALGVVLDAATTPENRSRHSTPPPSLSSL